MCDASSCSGCIREASTGLSAKLSESTKVPMFPLRRERPCPTEPAPSSVRPRSYILGFLTVLRSNRQATKTGCLSVQRRFFGSATQSPLTVTRRLTSGILFCECAEDRRAGSAKSAARVCGKLPRLSSRPVRAYTSWRSSP